MKQQILDRLRSGLSERALALLTALLDHAETIDLDAGADEWHCRFPPPEAPGEAAGDERDLHFGIARAPASSIPDGIPPALARFLGVCAGMVCGEPGDVGQLVLHDGTSGTLHVVGDDALNERACGFPYSPELCAPIDVDLQSFYLVHPSTGKLHYYDGEGVLEPARADDPVEAYLLTLHERFRLI